MIIAIPIILFIGQLPCQFAPAQVASGESKRGEMNIVLQESEITGIKIDKTKMKPWWKGTDAKGKPDETKGVEQYTTFQSVQALILYAEFESAEEAHQAAEFYSKNMASIFQAGLWSGAGQKTIGDESWYAQDATATALLVRSGRTCVLISCHDGDAKKRNHVAEMIGKRIEGKVKLGGRVIVPSDRQKD